jgi:hypothetical protein
MLLNFLEGFTANCKIETMSPLRKVFFSHKDTKPLSLLTIVCFLCVRDTASLSSRSI